MPAFTDPDGDTVTYAAALDDDSALPGWLSFTPNTRIFSGTPLESDTPGSLTIRITATDDGEPPESTSTTFTLTVEEVNDPPATPSLADQAAIEDQSFSYTFNAVTDPEGHSVTYSAILDDGNTLPAWITFTSSSRTFSGTPEEGDVPATLTIRVTAKDNGTPPAMASETFTLTVSERNDAPIAGNDTATVTEGGAVSIAASTLLANDSDPDDDTLVITAVSDAASGSVILSEDGETVTYTHNGLETTSGGFTYTVSDGSATDTARVVITVTPVNDPPEAPSLSNQTATEDEPFSYAFSTVSDAEGDGITYSATLADDSAIPGWLGFDASTRTFSGTPLEPDTPDTLAIRVTATDDGEPPKSASATFTLTVEEVNDPPVAMSLSNQTAFVDDHFSYTVPEASDPEGGTLTYDAFQGRGNDPLPRWLKLRPLSSTAPSAGRLWKLTWLHMRSWSPSPTTCTLEMPPFSCPSSCRRTVHPGRPPSGHRLLPRTASSSTRRWPSKTRTATRSPTGLPCPTAATFLPGSTSRPAPTPSSSAARPERPTPQARSPFTSLPRMVQRRLKPPSR